MENDNEILLNKLTISFDIDVPKCFNESVFNSIILGLAEYKNLEKEEWNADELKIKFENDLIMRIQAEFEQLIKKIEE